MNPTNGHDSKKCAFLLIHWFVDERRTILTIQTFMPSKTASYIQLMEICSAQDMWPVLLFTVRLLRHLHNYDNGCVRSSILLLFASVSSLLRVACVPFAHSFHSHPPCHTMATIVRLFWISFNIFYSQLCVYTQKGAPEWNYVNGVRIAHCCWRWGARIEWKRLCYAHEGAS